ncbi:DUF3850 domain-containing protein [Yersinia enterocolitica]|uniref:DUF3850 domain-containing protein n=1 Tax=Yersinia enterocolitica TaxID=630 RepID=UPI0028A2874E|nr:DUF3850 domain-containing protein [Yersinia enterocolitica]
MIELANKRVHDLKIYPEYFLAVCTGDKRAELRKNDRDYHNGDVLHLCEFSKTTGYTGKYINVVVTHVTDISDWLPGYVLLSFKLEEWHTDRLMVANTPKPTLVEYAKQVNELVMWIKRLAHSLSHAKPESKLPDEAKEYLRRKGLVSVGDVLR